MIDYLLVFLLTLNFISATIFSLPFAFFPPFAQQRDISQDFVGIIFGSYPLGAFVFSIILAKYLGLLGRKRTQIILLILQSLTVLLFSQLDRIQNNKLIIFLALLCRLLQGIANSGIATVTMAYFSDIYQDTLAQKIGYFEVIFGLSMSTGVNIGYYLERWRGYQAPFLFAFVASISALIPQMLILPKDRKQGEEIEEPILKQIEIFGDDSEYKQQEYIKEDSKLGHNDRKQKQKYKALEIKEFMQNQEFVMAFVICVLIILFAGFINTTLALHLLDMENGDRYFGISFGTYMIIYTLANILQTIYLDMHQVNRKYFIVLGLILLTFGLLLTNILNVFVICFGLAIFGLGQALAFLQIMPELTAAGFSISDEKEKVSNLCSGILNAGCMLGEFLGSIMGGYFMEYLGYQNGSLIVCLISIIVIYAYFNLTDAYNELKIGRKKISTQAIELEDVPFQKSN